MAKNSLLKKIARALGEEENVTSEDLDRELADAVATIQSAGVELVDTDDITGSNWGDADDKIHVLNLAPIYKAMGSRSERLMFGAKTICEHIFEREVRVNEGVAYFEADHFVMQLTGLSDEEGFHPASEIVNMIGTQILGNRFAKLQVPGLLVSANVGDVTNKDGSLNMKAVSDAAKEGGIAIPMKEPEENDPVWVKLRWKTKLSGRGKYAGMSAKERNMTDQDWEVLKREAKKHKQEKPVRNRSHWATRSAQDRRQKAKKIDGEDRRHSFDRRGRGH